MDAIFHIVHDVVTGRILRHGDIIVKAQDECSRRRHYFETLMYAFATKRSYLLFSVLDYCNIIPKKILFQSVGGIIKRWRNIVFSHRYHAVHCLFDHVIQHVFLFLSVRFPLFAQDAA